MHFLYLECTINFYSQKASVLLISKEVWCLLLAANDNFSIPSDHGKESSVQLNNMSGDGVLQAMEKLVTSGAPWFFFTKEKCKMIKNGRKDVFGCCVNAVLLITLSGKLPLHLLSL